MKTKEEIEAAIAPLQAELHRMRDAETLAASKKLVGKHFKYRNNYSCPQKPSDYWWYYVKIVGVGDFWPIAFTFQTDQYGKLEIEEKRHFNSTGYTEISAKEFNAEWRKVQKRIARMKP